MSFNCTWIIKLKKNALKVGRCFGGFYGSTVVNRIDSVGDILNIMEINIKCYKSE